MTAVPYYLKISNGESEDTILLHLTLSPSFFYILTLLVLVIALTRPTCRQYVSAHVSFSPANVIFFILISSSNRLDLCFVVFDTIKFQNELSFFLLASRH